MPRKKMKNILTITIILLSLFVKAQSVRLGTEHYILKLPEGETKFEVDETKMVLKFKETIPFDSILQFFKTQEVFATFDSSWQLNFPVGIIVAKLKAEPMGKSYVDILANIQQNSQIIFTAPVLSYKTNTQQALYDLFYVKLKNPSDTGLLKGYAEKLGFVIQKMNESLIYCRVTKNSAGNAFEIAKFLQGLDRFEFVEPDFIYWGKIETNDPYFNSQWALNNSGQFSGTSGDDIDIANAWGISTGSPTIKVAIIDAFGSIAQFTHPDISFYGYYDASGLGFSSSGYPNEAHGISCAGIIGATANNSIGIAGIANNCRILAVKIGSINSAGTINITTTSISNGIIYAYQHADVISNSLTYGSTTSLIDNAITNAITSGRSGKGTPFLTSAGNTNSTTIGYPASNPNTIAVGATSMCDERKSTTSCDGETWWGSDYGTGLDVCAPGVHIYTTDIAGSGGYTSGDYNEYFNGTSSACPVAAGIMALILSVDTNLTYIGARQILESSCEKAGGYIYNSSVTGQPNGTWSTNLGYGRVNAYQALLAASPNINQTGCLYINGAFFQQTGALLYSNNIVQFGPQASVITNGNIISSQAIITNSNCYINTDLTGFITCPVPSGVLKSFDIGTTSNNRIQIQHGTGSNVSFKLAVRNNVYGNPITNTSQITTNVVSKTWYVQPLSGVTNSVVTLNWNSGDELTGFTRTNCGMSKWQNGATASWSFLNGTNAAINNGTTPAYSRTSPTAGLNASIYYFGIGAAGSSLPVTLLSFDATKNNKNVLLNWSTTSEINSKRYEVERSINVKDWEAITKQKAAGNSNSVIKYAYTDLQPFTKLNSTKIYYRLKMFEKDGLGMCTDIREVEMNEQDLTIDIFPNPATDILIISIRSNETKELHITLIDINGKKILERNETCNKGIDQKQIDVSNLATGLYFLKIRDTEGTNISQQKIIIN